MPQMMSIISSLKQEWVLYIIMGRNIFGKLPCLMVNKFKEKFKIACGVATDKDKAAVEKIFEKELLVALMLHTVDRH